VLSCFMLFKMFSDGPQGKREGRLKDV